MTRTALFVLAVLFAANSGAQTPQATQVAHPPPLRITLEDLFADPTLAAAALSPSGRFVALVLRRKASDMIAILDLQDPKPRVISNIPHDVAGKQLEAKINSIEWKSEDRLLFRARIRPVDDARFTRQNGVSFQKMGTRLFAVNRDGTHLVRLLAENAGAAMVGASNLGRVASMLQREPDHILMVVDGDLGPSLLLTDINSGVGTVIEKPDRTVAGWWLDLDGAAVVRLEVLNGSVRFLRKDETGKWKKFLSYRVREFEERGDFESVGPSDQPGKYYVIARPPGAERHNLYLYDLATEQFGAPVVENPQYDIQSAQISQDGKRVLRYCYVAHVQICEFTNAKLNSHMRGVRKFFHETANVYVTDSSDDDNTMLLYVKGPSDPATYYYYRADQARVEPIGMETDGMAGREMPSAAIVRWKARDGRELTGYLTRPPASANAKKMPLIVYPHGGPESRDHLDFDLYVQYFASLGYAVFQPNFRGSDGFGKEFVESGWGEWGRKMQDDITDGVDFLINAGEADGSRVAIVGASYGGYAALAGITLTPDKYRCAVSIAGISDLPSMVTWRLSSWSKESESYTHIRKMIGDPKTDEARMDAVSPAQLAAAVKVPLLLVHGEEDGIVPISQSERMKKAMDKAGKKAELIRIPEEGHGYWEDKNEKKVLSAIEMFLGINLGPGISY